MDKKLMWLTALLLTGTIVTLAVQYFSRGSFDPTYLLGIIIGTVIAWFIISSSKRSWVYWVGMVVWILFAPGGFVGFIRLIASWLLIEIPVQVMIALYFLGVLGMIVFYYRTTHLQTGDLLNRPILDERYQYHINVSGYWAFLFLNLLIIAALLQPWVPQSQLGLWIGILIAGLVFWVASLLVMERKS